MNKKAAFSFRWINKIRRNHAIEHAALNILLRSGYGLAGYSDWRGIWVWGRVPSELLLGAVNQAIDRLNAGEKNLAIHPYCGTNFVASGVTAGLAAWLTMIGANDAESRLDRLPLTLAAATLALILSRPLGPWLQRKVTTKADVPEVRVKGITLYERFRQQFHRVRIQHPKR